MCMSLINHRMVPKCPSWAHSLRGGKICDVLGFLRYDHIARRRASVCDGLPNLHLSIFCFFLINVLVSMSQSSLPLILKVRV